MAHVPVSQAALTTSVSDALLRELVHFFKNFSLAIRNVSVAAPPHVHERTSTPLPLNPTRSPQAVSTQMQQPPAPLVQLLTTIGRRLTPAVYLHINAALKVRKKTSKAQVKRQSRIIPSLVYHIEQAEVLLLKLSKKCQVQAALCAQSAAARGHACACRAPAGN